jgi:hypothetical protein
MRSTARRCISLLWVANSGLQSQRLPSVFHFYKYIIIIRINTIIAITVYLHMTCGVVVIVFSLSLSWIRPFVGTLSLHCETLRLALFFHPSCERTLDALLNAQIDL